ncbi:MAG: DUF760 domain-containing protein [Cyanobacteriota bacterium]|nr:DUF760 domain-containing protein [Cyanobacteriota bacterium]
MNDLSNKNPDFSENSQGTKDDNHLLQYVQSMNSDIVSQLSQPDSEVARLMERNLRSMLGSLPPEHFGVAITTSREQLGSLLASAMVSGYFLNNAKQRMELERSLLSSATDS